MSNSLSGTFSNSINASPRLSLQNSQKIPSPVALLSPSDSNSSGDSPQCTPLKPYNSFGKTIENIPNSYRRRESNEKNFTNHRGNISLQLQYDAINTNLQVI